MLASQREVTDNFSAFDLLDDGVRFLPGLFADTLPEAPVAQIALLRMDGDLYTSTLDVLHALYDRVVPGGYVIVDDYALAPCRQAIDEFRAERGITDPVERINWTIVHWRKS
jgi:O-methyltransferase